MCWLRALCLFFVRSLSGLVCFPCACEPFFLMMLLYQSLFLCTSALVFLSHRTKISHICFKYLVGHIVVSLTVVTLRDEMGFDVCCYVTTYPTSSYWMSNLISSVLHSLNFVLFLPSFVLYEYVWIMYMYCCACFGFFWFCVWPRVCLFILNFSLGILIVTVFSLVLPLLSSWFFFRCFCLYLFAFAGASGEPLLFYSALFLSATVCCCHLLFAEYCIVLLTAVPKLTCIHWKTGGD